MDAVFSWIAQYGYGGLYVLLMLGIVGLPIPDETLLTFCGYLIWRGRLHPVPTFLSGFSGSITGISVSFLLGRFGGRPLIDRFGRPVGITSARIEAVSTRFSRTGNWLLAIGYFIPGIRHFTALVAGLSELGWPAFALYAYSGAAVWVCVFLSLGYAVGESWQHTSELIHKYLLLGTAAAFVFLAAVYLVRKVSKKT